MESRLALRIKHSYEEQARAYHIFIGISATLISKTQIDQIFLFHAVNVLKQIDIVMFAQLY